MGERIAVPDFTDWRDYPQLTLPPILDVALMHMVEHGYHATTVRTLARELNVTVPALYYHFENKQAILVALLEHAMDIVTSHVRAALSQAGTDPVRGLSAMVEALVLYMTSHRELAFLDAERRALEPENFVRYVAMRDELESQLRTLIHEGSDSGVFATTQPNECARAILAMCQAVAGWYRSDGELSPEEIARRYVRLAFAITESGVKTEPRVKTVPRVKT